jgi:hypothetical protein
LLEYEHWQIDGESVVTYAGMSFREGTMGLLEP